MYRRKSVQEKIEKMTFGKIINDTYPVFIKISEFNKVQENYEHKKF